MILNFYLRKNPPLAEMRAVEVKQFQKVKSLLRQHGINPNRLEYHQAIQTLARVIASKL